MVPLHIEFFDQIKKNIKKWGNVTISLLWLNFVHESDIGTL